MRLRPGVSWVASISLLIIVLGCATAPSTPSATASAVATPVSSSLEARATSTESATPTLGAAKCATTDTTNYAAVGWIGPRVVVLADHFGGCDESQQRLISIDPREGIWRTDAILDPTVLDFQIASDGQSVIAPTTTGVVVVSVGGKVAQLARPSTAANGWGSDGFRPTSGGGYLVVGANELDQVAPDFSTVTTHAVPHGYVVVGPTANPAIFVLATADDASLPSGLLGTPFRAYLWDEHKGSVRPVADSAMGVMSSPLSLVYLTLQGNKALSVANDGTVSQINLPGLPGLRSPDGTRYLSPRDPLSSDSQTIELRDSTTDRTITSFEGSIGSPAWRGSAVAVVSGGGDVPSELIVLDGTSISKLPTAWPIASDSPTATATAVPSDQSVPALTVDHPTLTVSPASHLTDGQTVEVRVTGFGVGGKVWISECASAADATSIGCGRELAGQLFLVTDDSRVGSSNFTVSAKAPIKYPSATVETCANRCIIVATLGVGFPYVVAPISFVG